MKVIKNKVCRMCNSTKFDLVINLGHHPLVNSLISKADLSKKDPTFPIKVFQCKSCKLVQIKDVIDAEEMFFAPDDVGTQALAIQGLAKLVAYLVNQLFTVAAGGPARCLKTPGAHWV